MDKKKPDCKYWEKCYQRNSEHRGKYNHPRNPVTVPHSPQRRTRDTGESSNRHSDTDRTSSNRSPSPRDCSSTEKSPTSFKVERTTPKRIRDSSCDSVSPENKKVREEETTNKEETAEKEETDKEETTNKVETTNIEETTDNEETTNEETTNEEETTFKVETTNKEESSLAAEQKEMDITQEYDEVMRNLSKVDHLELFQRRERYSQKAEYQDLLKDASTFLRYKFLVEMPSDFYKFWEFCESETKAGRKPQAALERFGLKLVGPFDFLAGNFHEAKIFEPGEYLRHWRFFYDPPEFQTIFVKQKTGLHFGYWRDDPTDKEDLLMARNDANKGHEFELVGGNCFETVLYYLDNDSGLTPFNRQAAVEFKKSIHAFAAANKIELSTVAAMKKKRSKDVVCKTFHTVGLVVPFNRKTQLGYRSLLESDAKLKKILEKFERAKGDEKIIASGMEDLQPLITAANIAVDECDFGTAIELGIDLFCTGHKELHSVVMGLLVTGYSMVKRPQFVAIIKSHMDGRRKETELSILD